MVRALCRVSDSDVELRDAYLAPALVIWFVRQILHARIRDLACLQVSQIAGRVAIFLGVNKGRLHLLASE